jgi:predicted enzyme related to lactoylglutathione lyase
MSEPRTYPEGVTSWIDIEQRDIEAAKAFYGGLFGWTFTDATPPDASFRYSVAKLHGLDAAGIGGPAGAGDGVKRPEAWTTYVAVTDAGAAAARIETAGGHVLVGPSDVGEWGRSAVCVIRQVCLSGSSRPASGSALRSTHPAHGTSVTYMPPTRRRPRRSTAKYSGGPSTSRVRDDDPPARLRLSSRGHRRSGDPHPSGRRHGTAWLRRRHRLARSSW